MQPISILALAGAASAFALESRQTPTDGCVTGVHVIAVGGSNYVDEFAYGRLQTLATNITAAIPNSDMVSSPYNKTEIMPQVLTPGASAAGTVTFGQYIQQYHAACPNTKIVTIGYSSGSVIAMNALCQGNVDQSLAGTTIIANIQYGDETYVSGQSYDRGTCTAGNGRRPRADPASLGAFIPITQSYCDFNDPQCCSGPAEDYQIHFVYPNKYDVIATNYVKSQFAAAGGSLSGNSSSSMSSATMSSTASSAMSTSTGFSFSNGTTASTASAAVSPITTATGAASSAAAATSYIASSLAGEASAAATSLTPANPNGQTMLVPSSTLFTAAFVGGMMFFGAALL